MTFQRIMIVGCGNMGGAMLEGWLRSGLSPDTFVIVDPALETAPECVALLREVPAERFDAVLLGVKPHMLGDVAPGLQAVSENTTILSILAGVELDVLQTAFPAARAHVRVMPNLAAALGKSPIALAASGLDDGDKLAVNELMTRLGTPEWIGEDEFDLVTALAGSGPGFVYRFIDALAAGAESLGLPREQAKRLAVATVDGASSLAAASEHDAPELARRVASPGGVTQVGLDILDDDKALESLLERTLRVARDRSAEMAREAREKV